MIDTSHSPHKLRLWRMPGITGTSAAFIDVSLVLVMTLLSAVAALKMHELVETPMEITTADPNQAVSDEPSQMSLEIFPDGVVIDRGRDRIPFDSISTALSDRGVGEGAISVCVSADVGYHEVRNVLAGAQKTLGQRTWIDCGGTP